MLRLTAELIAVTAEAHGGQADDYEPPAERLAALLAAPDRRAVPARATGEERRAEVAAFLIAAGGDG